MQETQGLQVWPLDGRDVLEKSMAAHSSILAWRIPRREKPGGLQSTGSRRVQPSWDNLAGKHVVKYSFVLLSVTTLSHTPPPHKQVQGLAFLGLGKFAEQTTEAVLRLFMFWRGPRQCYRKSGPLRSCGLVINVSPWVPPGPWNQNLCGWGPGKSCKNFLRRWAHVRTKVREPLC